MSETTPGETPVERRLREMVTDPRQRYSWVTGDHAAIDAGREAIRLLREPLSLRVEDSERWQADVRALLARCEGDR